MKVVTILFVLSIFVATSYSRRLNINSLANALKRVRLGNARPSFPMWRPGVVATSRHPHLRNRDAWPPHPGKDATENDYPIDVDKALAKETAENSEKPATTEEETSKPTNVEEGAAVGNEPSKEPSNEPSNDPTNEPSNEPIKDENAAIINYMEEVTKDMNDKLKLQELLNSKNKETTSNQPSQQEASAVEKNDPIDEERDLDRPLPIEKAWMPSDEWYDDMRTYLRDRSRDNADELDVDEPLPEKKTSLDSNDHDRDLDRPLPIEKAWAPSDEWQDERMCTKERSRDEADELDVDEPLPEKRNSVASTDEVRDQDKPSSTTVLSPLQEMYMEELSKDISNAREKSAEQKTSTSSKEMNKAPQEDITVERVWPPRSLHEIKTRLWPHLAKKHANQKKNKPSEN